VKTLQDALAEFYDASTLTSCDDYFMGGKVKKAERARVLFLIVNHKNIIGTGLHMSSANCSRFSRAQMEALNAPAGGNSLQQRRTARFE
jgi:hypothetical protein